MTEFQKALEAYEAHFSQSYPYAIGMGYKGKTDEENIRIIREAIEKNEPVEYVPNYIPGVDY